MRLEITIESRNRTEHHLGLEPGHCELKTRLFLIFRWNNLLSAIARYLILFEVYDPHFSSSRISLNTMTLQIQSDHVYTQLGVAISVTGIAQVSLE